MNIPFSFQKGNKAAGCEDAPPITDLTYSVVCDGLGGAGSTKHTILESGAETPVIRTSGYLGSRIVSKCVAAYYTEKAAELFSTLNEQNRTDNVNGFLGILKEKIAAAFEENMQKWEIKPSHSRTLKDFPTTLASAIYYPNANGLTILAVWAGDSRIYVLTPKKGLQLLSLDDAQNAENEMNSTSEMTNCISAGNSFHLNYAFYELNEPGIVFCCSDGCFDYLPSPLHFEWLILHTILECMPDSDGNKFGMLLAESIRDNIYESIGDDTTMAGIIVGMDSGYQMKSLYKGRMDESDKQAIRMNEHIKDLKKVQNEKDAAQKNCRLLEEKVFMSIHDAVCKALRFGNSGSLLYLKLTEMSFYREYTQRERIIEQKIDEECRSELQELEKKLQKTKNVCREMLISDYLKRPQQIVDQRGGSWLSWGGIFSQKNREQMHNGQENTNLILAKQSILACIEMYKHPYFKEIVSISQIEGNEIDKYIQSQIGRLEAVLNIMKNTDQLFLNLWSQAYYSTDSFIKERNQCDRTSQFDMAFKRTMNDPKSCEFISELSVREIAKYHEQRNKLNAVYEKHKKEGQQRLANIPEEFWTNHKVEILDIILSEDETALRNLFKNTDVQMERLLSYIEAKRTLGQVDNKIADIQRSIDRIWDAYKTDYQLFKQTTEKGVC